MLFAHILLAILSLGLAARARTEKTIIASVLSFAGAFTSGILLQATSGGLSLHGVSMLALFSIIYGFLIGNSWRRRATQISQK